MNTDTWLLISLIALGLGDLWAERITGCGLIERACNLQERCLMAWRLRRQLAFPWHLAWRRAGEFVNKQ